MRTIYFYTKKKLRRKRRPQLPGDLSYVRYCQARGLDPDPENHELIHDYLKWLLKVQELGER